MFWKQHVRLILSSAALFFGALVLMISLSKTPSSVLSSDGSYEASKRQLYLGGEILPDHVAYPVLMAIDRVKLEAASPAERVYLQIEYAARRMDTTQSLLNRDKQALALSTLTKSQKYLFHAAQEALDGQLTWEVQSDVLHALEFQVTELTQLKTQFASDADRAVIDQVLSESTVFINRLTSAVKR